MTTAADIIAKVKARFPGAVTTEKLDAMDPWFAVDRKQLVEIALLLRDDPELAFDLLHCLSAVDRRGCKSSEPIPAGHPHPGDCYELVYHLESTGLGHGIVLKVALPLDDPACPTLEKVWPTADWHEREAWDLMGIRFEGHHNLTRILCAEDWVGHPLRKDYEFPTEYHGISCRYGDRLIEDPRYK